MTKIYSTWEAKTKFSEIVRKVREGETVYVAYRGARVTGDPAGLP
jgi:antitoxin (DNA-binding transcriptional repressor) of toxin-antitoxin stability system